MNLCNLCLPAYIRKQILCAKPPDGCSVIDGALPALVEGHISEARIATVGINPHGAWYRAQYKPLCAGGAQRFWKDKVQYFEHRKYQYFTWLERILNACDASFGGQYDLNRRYPTLVASMDVVQWPTNPLWKDLDKTAQAILLADGVPFFKKVLECNPQIGLLLGNGRRAVEQIEDIFGVQFRKEYHQASNMYLYQGKLLDRCFIGWNLHSSSAVPGAHRAALASRVAELYHTAACP